MSPAHFERLLSPGRIGTMPLSNRILLAPMGTGLAEKGFVSRRTIAYYEARAKGDAGAVIVENATVDSNTGRWFEHSLTIDDDKYIPGMSELAAAIKRHAASPVLQLYNGTLKLQPGQRPVFAFRLSSHMTIDEIHSLVACFARGARRAKEAGFEGLEIHAAHYNTVSQFLSAAWNKRQDEYGGSPAKRVRFLLEILDRRCLMPAGYSGNILRVDLSSGVITCTPTPMTARDYIGGRGMGTKIYWDEVSPDITVFDPRSRIVIVTGPLGGLRGVSGSMWQILGKSPAIIPEGFCYSTLGGHWGANLKFAGHDGIVVHGASEKPVYLLIRDERAELRDASHLWGKGAVEVREILKGELGSAVKVLAIGPAGERLVSFAGILAENDASASSGFGAVFGSKRLKAIAVAGSTKVSVARPEDLEVLVSYVRELNRDKHITPMSTYARIPGVSEKTYACFGCICGCFRTIAETSDGKKSKRFCNSGCFYQEPVRRYYGQYNDVVIHANRLCNEFGLDTKAIESLTKWLSACFDAGVLNDDVTGLPVSRVGSAEFIEALVKSVALRQGFGDVLSGGVVRAANSVGGKARELASRSFYATVSGTFFDPRTYITTGVIYAMEPRQAMAQVPEVGSTMAHWVGWLNRSPGKHGMAAGAANPIAHRLWVDDPEKMKAVFENCYVSSEVIREVARRFWGSEVAADFSTYEGKALAAKKIQDRSYAKECLALCGIVWPNMHARTTADHVGDPSVESRILSAVTGLDWDEGDLNMVGERVFNAQRAIMLMEGRKGRQSDTLPSQYFNEPILSEAYNSECLVPGRNGEVISRKGSTLDREQFEKMKDEYYLLRGWDVPTGLPTREKLNRLGLGDIAVVLEGKGLLAASKVRS